MKNGRRLFLLLCLSTSVFALPAQAQDVPPAVQAMLDSMARQTNTKPSYASLEQASDGTVKVGRGQGSDSAMGIQTANATMCRYTNCIDPANAVILSASRSWKSLARSAACWTTTGWRSGGAGGRPNQCRYAEANVEDAHASAWFPGLYPYRDRTTTWVVGVRGHDLQVGADQDISARIGSFALRRIHSSSLSSEFELGGARPPVGRG